jgi:hypothetical protein
MDDEEMNSILAPGPCLLSLSVPVPRLIFQ